MGRASREGVSGLENRMISGLASSNTWPIAAACGLLQAAGGASGKILKEAFIYFFSLLNTLLPIW